MSLNRCGHCSPTYFQERETVIKQYKKDKNEKHWAGTCCFSLASKFLWALGIGDGISAPPPRGQAEPRAGTLDTGLLFPLLPLGLGV